jgi:Ca-activated chloride channel family protein
MEHAMRRICSVLIIVILGGLLAGCSTGEAAMEGALPRNALVVRMLYGSEKQAWIEAVTAEFNAQNNKSSSGQQIFVEAVPAGSADSLERIVSGAEQPAIWSPASSILVPLANERWAAANNGAQLVDGTPEPWCSVPW